MCNALLMFRRFFAIICERVCVRRLDNLIRLQKIKADYQRVSTMLKILFAGETAGNSANYLLAFFKEILKAQVHHVPSRTKLSLAVCAQPWDIFICSDFLSQDAPQKCQRKIVEQVRQGSGLIMIGGWGSFTGLDGKWGGSTLESVLPVQCRTKDDRIHLPCGAAIAMKEKHPCVRDFSS